MYIMKNAAELTDQERREVMEELTRLHDAEYVELVTGDLIEMEEGEFYVNENGPMSVAEAYRTITGLDPIPSDAMHADVG